MYIERDIIKTFKAWKDAPGRKPILLTGARQTGKTKVMEMFGKECFEYCALLDFERHAELCSVFQKSKSPERIIKELALYCEQPIIAGRTLLIFDEIQECEEALNSLKYFCEEAPEYHIIAAGSLLGVAVKRKNMGVPVGKVDIVRMYPVTFSEFLHAANPDVAEFVDNLSELKHLPEIILNKLNTEYRRYQVSGGMPEAVVAMLEGNGEAAVDKALLNILGMYEMDFARYAGEEQVKRIRAIWHSLPSQLSKENRKFVYKVVRNGARSKDYEDALLWLEDAGMIYRIYNISKPGMPLSAYSEINAFKVYACDCGLLRRLAYLPGDIIINPVANYTEFKGAMAENAVLQSIVPIMDSQLPYYWTSNGKAEVEFIVQRGTDIVPVEVKAEGNINGNSLSEYNKKYKPRYRIRFSSLNLQFNGSLLSCPSPLAAWTDKLFGLLDKQ